MRSSPPTSLVGPLALDRRRPLEPLPLHERTLILDRVHKLPAHARERARRLPNRCRRERGQVGHRERLPRVVGELACGCEGVRQFLVDLRIWRREERKGVRVQPQGGMRIGEVGGRRT